MINNPLSAEICAKASPRQRQTRGAITGPFGKVKIIIPNVRVMTPSARACQRRASRTNTDPRTTTGISQPNPMWPAMPPSTLPAMITARTLRMIRRAMGR
jgi:hypothetical protein